MSEKSLDSKITIVKEVLKKYGVSTKAIASIETRALRSSRRQTGEFLSNRQVRWKLKRKDPQYSTRVDAKKILLGLLISVAEFCGFPCLEQDDRSLMEMIAKRKLQNALCDPLTFEELHYTQFLEESMNPIHGRSSFHIGHIDPTLPRKHQEGNVRWVTKLSNMIQGTMPLKEAQAKIKDIARKLDV